VMVFDGAPMGIVLLTGELMQQGSEIT